MKKNALRLRHRELFISAGLQTLYSSYVEQGKQWCLEQITWEIDKATIGGNTRCRLYIFGHGYKHDIAEEFNPLANTLYWWKEPVFLYSGERLALDIDEAQANTTAQMILTGFWEEVKG